MGRPRKVGKRLPGLKALVNNPLADSGDEGLVWSGYPLRHLSNRSLVQNWDASRAIRWVLIKDPKGKLSKRSMHGLDATPVQILQWFHLAGR